MVRASEHDQARSDTKPGPRQRTVTDLVLAKCAHLVAAGRSQSTSGAIVAARALAARSGRLRCRHWDHARFASLTANAIRRCAVSGLKQPARTQRRSGAGISGNRWCSLWWLRMPDSV
jgi:hypothetical protein